ncbi:MAG: cytochrome c biogenesis heme-transporting ATPase CcmA [Pseudomonadales bacterium]
MSQTLLNVSNLSCERDGRQLFCDLSFSLRCGELLQVAGPNGSGKTSLLRILCGLGAYQQGQVNWFGDENSGGLAPDFSRILFLGHQPGLKSALSPRENLSWYFDLRNSVSLPEIDAALVSVGLAGFEDVPTHQLSAGQQRRIALARLRLSKAEVWVLDEPFTAIDLAGVAELEAQLAEFVQAGGAVLLTTHHKLSLIDNVQRLELGGST